MKQSTALKIAIVSFILAIIILIFIARAFSQEASLDKKFYWTYEKSYAILRVVAPEPGLTLKVILWDKDKNIETVLINKPIETVKERFFSIDLLSLHTGNYSVGVHFGKRWSKEIEMVVLYRRN
jgi:hypothetical protein